MSDPPPLDGTSSPIVALVLLEALRHTDTPAEMLEDEDLQRSLPRRLGLSRAVDDQIRRYADLAARGVELPATQVIDLFSLVARRPDAADVFARAGDRLLGRHMPDGSLRRGLSRAPLPAPLRLRLALRRARAVARTVSPGSRVRLETRPPTLVLEGCLPARAEGGCRLLAAVLRGSLGVHGLPSRETEPPRVVHPLCERRGDGRCVWRVAAG